MTPFLTNRFVRNWVAAAVVLGSTAAFAASFGGFPSRPENGQALSASGMNQNLDVVQQYLDQLDQRLAAVESATAKQARVLSVVKSSGDQAVSSAGAAVTFNSFVVNQLAGWNGSSLIVQPGDAGVFRIHLELGTANAANTGARYVDVRVNGASAAQSNSQPAGDTPTKIVLDSVLRLDAGAEVLVWATCDIGSFVVGGPSHVRFTTLSIERLGD